MIVVINVAFNLNLIFNFRADEVIITGIGDSAVDELF